MSLMLRIAACFLLAIGAGYVGFTLGSQFTSDRIYESIVAASVGDVLGLGFIPPLEDRVICTSGGAVLVTGSFVIPPDKRRSFFATKIGGGIPWGTELTGSTRMDPREFFEPMSYKCRDFWVPLLERLK